MSAFKILETDGQIKNSILNILKDQAANLLKQNISKIQIELRNKFKQALKHEPEYESLKSGKLKAELGLPSTVSIDAIVDLISDSVKVDFVPATISNRGIKVGLEIRIFQKDGEPAISSTNAILIDELKGYSLPWLEWLLFYGTKPIVKNYSVRMGSNPYSRSGMAIMVEDDSSWRVPAEFAGTETNNWVTRALSTINDDIKNFLIQILKG